MTPLPLDRPAGQKLGASSLDAPTLGAFGRIRRSSERFAHAWRTPRTRVRAPHERHVDALLVLLAAGAVVAASLLADVWIPQQARLLSPGAVAGFRAATAIGTDGYMWALAGFVLLAAILAPADGDRRREAACDWLAARAAYFLCAVRASGLVTQVLKHLFGRARPALSGIVGPYHFDLFSISAKFASFPSGHTSAAFAAATALGCLAPRLRIPLFALATLVGVSRLALVAHFPSDVVGGACIGAACALLVRRLFAARGIAFALTPSGARLRGRGCVVAALRPRGRAHG